MSDGYVSKVDRRTALAWIGAAGAAVAGSVGLAVYGAGDRAEAKAYGTDPNLVKPAPAPWPRLLSKDELQAAAVLADFILPASATAPAASALGIPDFIDEWVSAPYPDQVKDRVVIRNGLQRIMPALLAGGPRRDAALAALPRAADEAALTFFKRFRALTVGAYYTTEAGFRDIGYIGNQARATDPGPSAEVKLALEERLKALGL
ncbi:gluconate 2-dehydrogenase subunit 3 family protein [Phenylobacterium sp.]|uniref:gluconate 2-dehydrogenase subunit 3 family protein n=1 Tax=Phenylobacterium sp. TaxID=1871053 RepID=UPI002C7B7192|nr:gluconate 2-dehydrogenase subunit 3 family protein [Phenylobacterium sp.]HVI33467.1 gluconate 2-dehydrogenase subunit 3 family protein [Phenylobacterium sp.]